MKPTTHLELNQLTPPAQHSKPRKRRPGWGGRRAKDGAVGTRATTVNLDAQTIERAREIGKGELSRGIREAVKAYKANEYERP